MPLKLKERNISNKCFFNWLEAAQLAIYKYDQGVALGSTKKQIQLSSQS